MRRVLTLMMTSVISVPAMAVGNYAALDSDEMAKVKAVFEEANYCTRLNNYDEAAAQETEDIATEITAALEAAWTYSSNPDGSNQDELKLIEDARSNFYIPSSLSSFDSTAFGSSCKWRLKIATSLVVDPKIETISNAGYDYAHVTKLASMAIYEIEGEVDPEDTVAYRIEDNVLNNLALSYLNLAVARLNRYSYSDYGKDLLARNLSNMDELNAFAQAYPSVSGDYLDVQKQLFNKATLLYRELVTARGLVD